MPKPYPREFRDDVVRVARSREPGVTIEQIAKDFGVHPMTLQKWLQRAAVEDGDRPGQTRAEGVELREARKRIRPLEQENEVLRRAAAYLSQANLPKRLYPLVTELAADGVPVAVTCRVLKLARQPYYRWLANPVTNTEVVEAYRANALFDAHRDDPEFGHRLLADEARDVGESMADRTAWRIASDNGWWSAFGKKRGKNGKKVGPPVHDDLVGREFTSDAPNRLWLTDITEHRTAEGKLYLCAIKDVFSNKIVGYSIDSRMKSSLAVRALENAVAMRGDVAGCVIHSDRGSQFRSRKFLRAITRHRMVGSMGKVGAAGDNAAMESFFSLLQKNVLDRRTWTRRKELRIAIVIWIERTYHRRRRQPRLGRLTPIEFEAIMNTPAALAA
ncbi:IS3 family transposase [Propionibacterium freudenreichii]|uniref:IS3 family transposase n=1 Tax=Propionibacterium freudenreichii TaxID=1744 RepID=UPI0021A700DF|nr:IS3 family transposase [Propionibacterium freudenreichii]MCT2985443.1 IS3 family transposase [Propionibacterium freudenreichii]